MYSNCFSNANPSVLVALFSLLWFGVGILIGTQMSGRASSRGRRKSAQGKGQRVEMYVGNLAYSVSERDLTDAFKVHGKVVRTRIIKNRSSGKSKGYGFVEMRASGNIDALAKKLNGLSVKGRKIVVNEAKSRDHE